VFKDHFSAHAADYASHRPTYPPELFAFLASVCSGRALAWDCGTGNGQAAAAVAEHFDRVFATDPSAEQITNAEPHPKVQYAVAPAEACPLADGSADLVTVAQAIHWFDFDRFYSEVRRVLKPHGVMAAWGYAFQRVNPRVDAVLAKLEGEFVRPYWPPERRYPEARYTTVPFPFAEIPAPQFVMSANWTLADTLGYLNTWSATRRFVKERGFNPVDRLAPELAAAWGDANERRAVSWDLFLKVGRLP
jgi:SAM-dependent methyltransferase